MFSAVYTFRYNYNTLRSLRVSICASVRAYLCDKCDARSDFSSYDVSGLNCSVYLLFSRYVAHIFYSRMYFEA
jgi:hypothetical protein